MRLRVAAIVLGVLLAGTTPARADSTADAKEHYKKATAAYALGKYADSALEYERAYELLPDPALLYNAAQANRIAGNKQRALLLYQNYLRIYGSQVGNTAEVRGQIDRLNKAIEADARTATAPPMSPVAIAQPSGTTRPPPPAGTEPAPATPPEPAPVAAPPVKAAPIVAVAPPPPEKKPLIKKPWFWAVIGGAAVVVVVGVAVGVVLGSPGDKDPSPSLATLRGN